MTTINDENAMTTNNSDNEEIKKYLLSEESFNLLRSSQEKIKQEIDLIPSFRKLINMLINPESIEKLTQRFIDKFK